MSVNKEGWNQGCGFGRLADLTTIPLRGRFFPSISQCSATLAIDLGHRMILAPPFCLRLLEVDQNLSQIIQIVFLF